MNHTLTVKGKTFDFELPSGTRPPVVFMGVRKSGSSIFFKIIQAICNEAGVPAIDLAQRFFSEDIAANEWRKLDEIAPLLQPGGVYTGFRAAPMAFRKSSHWAGARKIFMTRDPRDALVSQYFSTAFSHSLPSASAAVQGGVRETLSGKREMAKAMSVEEYTLQNLRGFVNTYRDYNELLGGQAFTLFRYEDVIFNKRDWLASIADAIGVTLSTAATDKILSWADVKPATERPQEFVRKVTPGDYREKLSAEVIGQLNAALGPVVARYGYELR